MATYSVDTWAFYDRKSMGVFRTSGSVSSTLKSGLYLEKLYFSKFLNIEEKGDCLSRVSLELNGWETLQYRLYVLIWGLMSALGRLCSMVRLLVCVQLTLSILSAYSEAGLDVLLTESDDKWVATFAVGKSMIAVKLLWTWAK